MANVKHPNIVPIYTFGECDDGAFLVMEYCAGGSLSERIEGRGSIPVAEALETVGKIAGALAAACKKGIVHRDVKPSNVLMDEDGGLFVADFGLARRVDSQGDASLTEEGIFVGTPHYIAPEVVSGKKADHRSDIYALGIVLYELLTGERPFQASSAAAVVALQIHGKLPNLRERCPEASEPLVALVESMTAKAPALAKNNDLFGTTVNLTDAICSQSDADVIVVSQVIRDLCRGKKLPFSEHGDAELAGFDEPIRLFEVDWREDAA